MEGNFIEAIVKCFNAPKASAFDYNLLEPLQKLLRLSSPLAASLARPDLCSGILQKLNHKKAVVRLNLLRIVRSICDPGEEQARSVRDHPLFEAIQHLAEGDTAVLVRNMASDLVKASLKSSPEVLSGGRPRTSGGHGRRGYTPPSLLYGPLTPMTPTNGRRGSSQASAFMEGSVTPRRAPAMPVASSNDSALYRPKSREGPPLPLVRRTSSELSNNSMLSKSRVPRPSMLRGSRSSVAAPAAEVEPAPSRRENGARTRDQSRYSALSSPGGTAPQLNSKRKPRVPSGDIKWS